MAMTGVTSAPSLSSERALLSLEGVSKAFGATQALKPSDFGLRAGEVRGLVGKNGAGKSTLVSLIAGVNHADAGVIRIDGMQTSFNGPREAQRAGISFLPQRAELIHDLTVAENVFLGRLPTRAGGVIVDWDSVRAQAAEVLAVLGMEGLVDVKAGHLSRVDGQLVSIAAALAVDARVLILDEPTAGLSTSEISVLFGALDRLRSQRSLAIIYISHKLAEIFLLCESVTVLRDGCVVGTRSVGELTPKELASLMVGDGVDTQTRARRQRAPQVRLEIEDLSAEPEVKSVSLTVSSGEIVGLIGLSTSGKSEFLQTLFGLRPRTAGRVRIAGQLVNFRTPAHAIRAGVSFAPGDRLSEGLVGDHSLTRNTSMSWVRSFRNFLGVIRLRSVQERSITLMHRMAVKASSVESLISELSGGNQQKVLLARTLGESPEVLLLDGPFQGIDIQARGEIQRRILDIAADGTSIVMCSDEVEDLRACDRILVFRNGSIEAEFSPDEAEEIVLATVEGLSSNHTGGSH